jgi:hypothetical protein
MKDTIMKRTLLMTTALALYAGHAMAMTLPSVGTSLMAEAISGASPEATMDLQLASADDTGSCSTDGGSSCDSNDDSSDGSDDDSSDDSDDDGDHDGGSDHDDGGDDD